MDYTLASFLTAATSAGMAQFGAALAMRDTLLVVGAPYAEASGREEAGVAFVFNATDGAMMQPSGPVIMTTLVSQRQEPRSYFGTSIDISSKGMVVGEIGIVSSQCGYVTPARARHAAPLITLLTCLLAPLRSSTSPPWTCTSS